MVRRSASAAPSAAGSSAPPSPTMSAHTTTTNVGIAAHRLPPHLINRADLRNSLDAYDALLAAAKTYTQALVTLGAASSELAMALDGCSRLKGAHDVGSGMLAASGIHHMSGNAYSILADSFWKETSIPLLEHHDLYVQACADRSVQHEKAILAKSKALHEAERRNQRNARGKAGRDLHSFRRALNELQRHVDELDDEKARYYTEVLEGEEDSWAFVQNKVISALRSQIDTHERIAGKGLSDPVLEPLLAGIPDPFSAYGPPCSDEHIYSILSHGVLDDSPTKENVSAEARGLARASAPAEPIAKGQQPLAPADFIMSPSTPSKGLSRVTSGAASPQVPTLEDAEASGSASPRDAIAAGSRDGLGVSLMAAAELAQQDTPADATPKPKGDATRHAQVLTAAGESSAHPNAELFGTDGEDDGGDEASIFSGTEEDDGRWSLKDNGDDAGAASDGRTPRQPGMAARIMAEKKRRREHAVRTSAKTRLKHALSTIDESKTQSKTPQRQQPYPHATGGGPDGHDTADGAVGSAGAGEDDGGEQQQQQQHRRASSNGSSGKIAALGERNTNVEAVAQPASEEKGAAAADKTALPPEDSHDREAHAVWG